MQHRAPRVLVLALAFGCLGFGVQALAAGAKLPKCASVKCRDLGCPADVLCVSGSKVQTCADVCNGN
ncbi:MAG TPA: hypothetical protein VFV75_05410 [Candidatus Polarisedimenticolaceae bacterium]|nr:hypothetical protein [Candidatus Polarisedimenticolaceae bacterium]